MSCCVALCWAGLCCVVPCLERNGRCCVLVLLSCVSVMFVFSFVGVSLCCVVLCSAMLYCVLLCCVSLR